MLKTAETSVVVSVLWVLPLCGTLLDLYLRTYQIALYNTTQFFFSHICNLEENQKAVNVLENDWSRGEKEDCCAIYFCVCV